MGKGIHGVIKQLCLGSCLTLWVALNGFGASPLTVTSPGGTLSVTFELKSNAQPYLPGERAYYRVSFNGKAILKDSPLGLDFSGRPALDHGFEVTGSKRAAHDSTWTNAFGAVRSVRDHYNQLTVSLRERESPGRRLDLIFRAYDSGIAFRYFLPRQEGLDKFTLSSEDTGFYFPGNPSAFALNLGSYTTSYESEFQPVRLDEIKPTSIVGIPLLVHVTDGAWAAILEADLDDYAGMYLGGVRGVPGALISKLSPLPEHSDQAVIASTPKATPWHVLLVNSEPGGLIESDNLILNLNPPSALTDTSWIKPGKAAWDWWSGSYASGVNFKPGMNTATMKHYIDFASKSHFAYMLIDAGWSPEDDITRTVPEIDMPAILAYAKQRNVRILLWMQWKAVNKQMNQAFPLFEEWGVAGVKIDYMDRNDQEMVNFYRRTVKAAAEHHLAVDFHGAYPPAGLRRTYPNLLTREGVMGMEYNKWSRRQTPEHLVTIPFTRMLAGPMDYTPGCFNNATREQFQSRQIQPMCQGTRANQLAMYVVYLSPLEMVSDYPEDYLGQPGFEFLEKAPTVWDDTRVLNGEPSEYVTIARRHGNEWFLGSMTNWTSRDLAVPLSFLGPGMWNAQIFADGPNANQNAKDLSIISKQVTPDDTLPLHLASGGGAAVIFTQVK
ncbi:MAG TPA: glycoside hydrolase family 97 protein [Terriglobia bacterium]|nr:glycoside hydrolase family 97 protein [Terriglobia bacterium]